MKKEKKRVLIITPHPDDMEISMGGTALLLKKAGYEIRQVIATRGDKGTTDIKFSGAKMAATRTREQKAACKITGTTVTWLGLKDGGVVYDKKNIKKIVDIIRQYKPHLVFGMDPWRPYDLHTDHRNLGWCTVDAVVAAGFPLSYPAKSKAYWEIEDLYLLNPVEPDICVNIRSVLKDKAKIIAAHECQFPGGIPETRKMVERIATRWKEKTGVPYSECFKRVYSNYGVMEFDQAVMKKMRKRRK